MYLNHFLQKSFNKQNLCSTKVEIKTIKEPNYIIKKLTIITNKILFYQTWIVVPIKKFAFFSFPASKKPKKSVYNRTFKKQKTKN